MSVHRLVGLAPVLAFLGAFVLVATVPRRPPPPPIASYRPSTRWPNG